MDILGWIFLSIMGTIGLIVVGMIAARYVLIEFKLFKYKLKSELAIRKKDLEIKYENKEERVAQKRDAEEELKNLQMSESLNNIQSKIDSVEDSKKNIEKVETTEESNIESSQIEIKIQ